MRNMARLMAVLAVIALALPVAAVADHDQIPDSIPGISATAVPDLTKLVVDDVVSVYYKDPTSAAIVAIASYLPWDITKYFLYEWRVPTKATDGTRSWRYYAAFADGKTHEIAGRAAIQMDNGQNLTVTLYIPNGTKVARTFSRPTKQ